MPDDNLPEWLNFLKKYRYRIAQVLAAVACLCAINLVAVVKLTSLAVVDIVWLQLDILLAGCLIILAMSWYRHRRKGKYFEKKLRIAEKQYAAVLKFNSSDFEDKSRLIELTLNHMNQGVAVVRPDGRIWLYNKQSLDFAGVDEEKLPFPPTFAAVTAMQIENGEFGEDGCLLPPSVRDFIYHRKGVPPAAYFRRRPNGRILEVRSDPMPDGSVIQTYTDTTELSEAKEAAEVAAKAKASFLATMSHEIRTPLNGVLGAANLLRNTQIDSGQKEFVDLISSCGEALLVVINDILDFSKFESSGVMLEKIPVSLNDMFRSAMLVTQSAVKEKGLSLDLKGVEQLPPAVLTDAKRLKQVLINLLGNAVKFTSEGGVTIAAEVRETFGKHTLRVNVVDTGIGIAQEKIDSLFQEFSQEDESINRRFGGTGLGLAICKKIIEAMDGEIGVESTPGTGSTFWFQVPLELTDREVEATDLSAVKVEDTLSYRILVAEDIATNQLIIRATLEALGHQVRVVSNGAEAVQAVQEETFDILLLDMQMPEMDGTEAARRIRQLGGTFADIPILALTANAFSTDADICFEAGMNDVLTKPFEPSQIQAAMNKWFLDAREAHMDRPAEFSGDEVEDQTQAAIQEPQEAIPRDLESEPDDTGVQMDDPVPPVEPGKDHTHSVSSGIDYDQLEKLRRILPSETLIEAIRLINNDLQRLMDEIEWDEDGEGLATIHNLLTNLHLALFDLGLVEAGHACSVLRQIVHSGACPDQSSFVHMQTAVGTALEHLRSELESVD